MIPAWAAFVGMAITWFVAYDVGTRNPTPTHIDDDPQGR